MKCVHRFLLQRVALTGIPWREVKHNEVAHSGFARHETGLSRREVIAVAGFLCVAVQVGGFAVEDIGSLRKGENFRFVLLVVAGVDDVGDLLSPRDGQKLFPYMS